MDKEFLRRFTDGVISPICPEILEIDNILTNIPYLVIPDSKIEPDDWDLFWELWNRDKSPMAPEGKESTAIWNSLAIWANSDLGLNYHSSFPLKYENWERYFPKMIDKILTVMPFKRIDKITMSMNIKPVNPHIDPATTFYPWPNSLRIMLWDSNENGTFYLKKWSKESLLKPPISSMDPDKAQIYEQVPKDDNEKIYVNLPVSSNTFVYSNGEFLHGADLAKPKIIVLVWGEPNPVLWKTRLRDVIKKGNVDKY